MTTENLIDLFEKGIERGSNFLTNVGNIYGKQMEFQYTLQDKHPSLVSPSLGRIGIVCELWPADYSDDYIQKTPFGVRYFIKYETNIEGINPFKFEIEPNIFSRLIKPFRVKEKVQASMKDTKKIVDFKHRMEKLEANYDIEVTSSHRQIITEKTGNKGINKY